MKLSINRKLENGSRKISKFTRNLVNKIPNCNRASIIITIKGSIIASNQ